MDKLSGKLLSVNTGEKVGAKKTPVHHCRVIPDFGIENDAHAGTELRQISLLAKESIDKMRAKGLDVQYGDFAENLTTEGISLVSLSIGTKLKVGSDVLLEITQIGKICHNRCRIFYEVGDCVMPKEGIFARVLNGGEILPGDTIMLLPKN